MGYITDKDKMIYKSLKDLKPVELVLNESDEAIRIKTRTLDDSGISKILCATSAATATTAAGAGFAASVSALGIGALVLGAPLVILGGVVALCCSASQDQKLQQAKEICYTTALRKQNAIIEELRKERYEDKKRIEYLTALNNSLNGIIADLTHDLGY